MKRLSTLLILLYFGFSAFAQPDTLSQQSQLQDNAYQYPNYLQGVGAGNHGWSRDWWRAKQRIDSLLDAGFASDAITPSDTAAMLAAYALLSELPAAQSLSFNTSTNVLSISESNGVDLSSLSGGGGGSSGYADTIIIGGSDTIVTNTDARVLFISLAEDELYLSPSLAMDSLAEFYIENHRGGDLTIIAGLSNSLNDGTNTTLIVPERGGLFIRCLGTIGGAIRFSAIGNYTE